MTLKGHRADLRQYIKAKEERSADDISTMVGRDKKIGYVTSFFPIISLRRIFSNYAEKKGVLYKTINPSADYKPGRPVLFPKARNFFGAKRKDRRRPITTKKGIISRVHNIGDAQYLTRIIDNIEKREGNDLDFYREIYHQMLDKERNRIDDSYYRLLLKMFDSLDKEKQNEITKDYIDDKTLQEKRDFLDWSAENTNPNDYKRGEDYSYDTLKKYAEPLDREMNFEPIRKHLKITPLPVNENDVKQPEKFESDSPPIELPIVPRFFDAAMQMQLKSNASEFEKYVIKGTVEKDKVTKIVGKDNQPLEDGWYQFVIMPSNGNPEIRYYPCGEKQDGPPLYQQIEQIKNEAPETRTGEARKDGDDEIKVGNKYTVTSPKTSDKNPVPMLKYDKYVAHSQLAGGQPVLSGGAFMVVDGKVEIVEDSSGHYASEKDSKNEYGPISVAYQAFNCFGILSKNCAFERWEPYKGIDKLFKKTAGALQNPMFPTKALKENRELGPLVAEKRPAEPGNRTPAQVLLKRKKPVILSSIRNNTPADNTKTEKSSKNKKRRIK